MKHIIIYGLGNSVTTLVEDGVAKDLKGKFDKGEAIEINTSDSQITVRAGSAWAIKVEEFAERRSRTDTQQ